MVALLFLKKTQKDIQVLPTIFFPMILFTSIVLSVIIFFPHDTFGGRDESIFPNYAVYLANNHTLNLPSYLNNLPTNYAEGVRARLPAYTVWLAIQNIFFGNQWLLRSNAVLIMLGLFSFFLTASYLSNKKIALLCSILLGSTMPFLWFMRETMTENLSFFLLWFSILSLITYLKSKNALFLVATLFGTWVFSLTRIEGLFIQMTFLITLIFFTLRNNIRNIIAIFVICIFFISSSLLIVRFFGFSSYFIKNIDGARSNLNQDISIFVSNTNPTKPLFKTLSWQHKEVFLYNKMPEFIAIMLNKYNYVVIFLSICILITITSFSKQKYKYSKKLYLLILFIILPEFYKFVSPSVTLDQPWLYRRYLYALLPLGYLSFSILLWTFNKRLFTLIIFCLMFVINIIFSSNILFLKNNWILVDKLDYLLKNISKNDLVIIRSWTLGYYYPASYLIIQKGVRSSFVSEIKPSILDVDKNIFNGIPYGKIFLLSTNKNEKYLDFVTSNTKSIDISYSQLEPLCQLYEIGLLEKYKNPYDFNLIPYNYAVSHCTETYNTIMKHNETLYLYELSKNK